MSNLRILIRPAEPRDGSAIAEIYAPIVRDTAISFETEPPGPNAMAQRIESITRFHPWLVAELAERVVGYAYASEHRARAAYRWSTDVTAYVAVDMRGRSIGRALYERLIRVLRAQGFHGAFAGIALPNDASVALHEAVGFRSLGIYREVGFKLGRWRDVGWWQLVLANHDGPPVDPIPFDAFRYATNLDDLLK